LVTDGIGRGAFGTGEVGGGAGKRRGAGAGGEQSSAGERRVDGERGIGTGAGERAKGEGEVARVLEAEVAVLFERVLDDLAEAGEEGGVHFWRIFAKDGRHGFG